MSVQDSNDGLSKRQMRIIDALAGATAWGLVVVAAVLLYFAFGFELAIIVLLATILIAVNKPS